jgi:hypothetical protein
MNCLICFGPLDTGMRCPSHGSHVLPTPWSWENAIQNFKMYIETFVQSANGLLMIHLSEMERRLSERKR